MSQSFNRELVEALEHRVRSLDPEDVITDLIEYMYEWAQKHMTEQQINNFIDTGEW